MSNKTKENKVYKAILRIKDFADYHGDKYTLEALDIVREHLRTYEDILINEQGLDIEYMDLKDKNLYLKGVKAKDVLMNKADIEMDLDLRDTVIGGTVYFNNYGRTLLRVEGDISVSDKDCYGLTDIIIKSSEE